MALPVFVGEKAKTPPGWSLGAEIATDAPTFLEWLRQEGARFNEYVGKQFAMFERRRLELAQQESRAQASCIRREQELNLEKQTLTALAEGLKKREEALAKREAEIAGEIEQKRAAMDERLRELERAEESIQRRIAELDEVEDHFRREVASFEREREVQQRLNASSEFETKVDNVPLPPAEEPLPPAVREPEPPPPVKTKLDRWFEAFRARREQSSSGRKGW
jgi:hypothetical protein